MDNQATTDQPSTYRQNIWDSFPELAHVRAPVDTTSVESLGAPL